MGLRNILPMTFVLFISIQAIHCQRHILKDILGGLDHNKIEDIVQQAASSLSSASSSMAGSLSSVAAQHMQQMDEIHKALRTICSVNFLANVAAPPMPKPGNGMINDKISETIASMNPLSMLTHS